MIRIKINKKSLLLLGFLILLNNLLFSQSFKESRFNKNIYSIQPGYSTDNYLSGFGGYLSHLKSIGKHFIFQQDLGTFILNENSPNKTSESTNFVDREMNDFYQKDPSLEYSGKLPRIETSIDFSLGLGYSPFRIDKKFFTINAQIVTSYKRITGLYKSPIQSEGTEAYYEKSHLNFEPQIALQYYTQIKPELYLIYRLSYKENLDSFDSCVAFTIGFGFDSKQLKRKSE